MNTAPGGIVDEPIRLYVAETVRPTVHQSEQLKPTIMPIEFRLPELGENIKEAEVAEILVKEGDVIEAEQTVLELETEKAVIELPCPHAGRVTKIHVTAGDTIVVGAVVLTLNESGGSAAPDGVAAAKSDPEQSNPTQEKPAAASKPASAKPSPPSPTAQPTAAKSSEPDNRPPPPAGPATRQFARKLGVDLHLVTGTGTGGRITREDIEAYVTQRLNTPDSSTGSRIVPPLPDFTPFGSVERQRLSKLNRTAAEQLSTSWHAIPHVTQHDLADVTELESVRKRFLQSSGKSGPKITVTAIAVKACVQLLIEMPHFNSSLDVLNGELVLKRYYHIGVAVDTAHGLVVPVIKDADEKSILEIAGELTDLAEKARDRKLQLADMQGATFTITNLGGIGGTLFTPIVNYPEVAILGLSRAQKQPAFIEGNLQERLMLPLSLSYDHRVINGADAARFIVRLSALLAQPFGLLANV